jgi:uncharacterized membrane protein
MKAIRAMEYPRPVAKNLLLRLHLIFELQITVGIALQKSAECMRRLWDSSHLQIYPRDLLICIYSFYTQTILHHLLFLVISIFVCFLILNAERYYNTHSLWMFNPHIVSICTISIIKIHLVLALMTLIVVKGEWFKMWDGFRATPTSSFTTQHLLNVNIPRKSRQNPSNTCYEDEEDDSHESLSLFSGFTILYSIKYSGYA